MYVVSMVSDYYEKEFGKRPGGLGDLWQGLQRQQDTPSIAAEIAELRKLIVDFRQAMEAAKRVDVLTAQPDCVDPKKATLVDRVADLERRLDSIGI